MASYTHLDGSLLDIGKGKILPMEWKPEYLPIVAGTLTIFAVAMIYGIKKKRIKKKRAKK